MDREKINGYILAGGKSSRMGIDKGSMLFQNKPIIEYIIDQLQPAASKVVIVSNNSNKTKYEKFGIEVIEDEIKDSGPAGGIYTALNHSDTEMNFIVSCDMPFIKTNAVRYVIENTEDFQITLPVHGENIETLFGVYGTNCRSKWHELINQKNLKLQEMVLNFKLNKVNVDNNELFTESIFMNINDKNDFEKAYNLIQNGN
ncbi:MAG TPA: molybdenum cofactor guanylyltransferase [Ignavibacteria bacterium]|nr:molybdenum cofactor guanylyltransferase [Ignavibacteria bacterium]